MPGLILVIEDEAIIALAMETVLIQAGYECISVGTFEAATSALSSQDFVGCILDYHLHGHPTVALAEELKVRNVPFVLCSGTSPVDLPAVFQGVPFVDKPFGDDALLSALRLAVAYRSL